VTIDRAAPAAPRAGLGPAATPSEPTPAQPAPRLVDLAPTDVVWLGDVRDHLRPAGAVPLDAGTLSTCYDHYNEQWCTAPAEHRWDPRYLISAIGVALGDLLIERVGAARWQRVDDPRARIVAVRLEERRATVFPVDAVGRRWWAEERGWIEEWAEGMAPGAGR